MTTETTTLETTVTLPEDTQILIVREFAAPKHLVYRAWTTPELVRRWWCGRRGTMKVVEIDLRVGGAWRYVMAGDGWEVGFHGEYREIVANERIVTTEVYEGAPGGDDDPPLNVITFREVGARTRVELLVQCPNREVRDAIAGSGMEVGVREQMEILDEILRELA